MFSVSFCVPFCELNKIFLQKILKTYPRQLSLSRPSLLQALASEDTASESAPFNTFAHFIDSIQNEPLFLHFSLTTFCCCCSSHWGHKNSLISGEIIVTADQTITWRRRRRRHCSMCSTTYSTLHSSCKTVMRPMQVKPERRKQILNMIHILDFELIVKTSAYFK